MNVSLEYLKRCAHETGHRIEHCGISELGAGSIPRLGGVGVDFRRSIVFFAAADRGTRPESEQIYEEETKTVPLYYHLRKATSYQSIRYFR